MLVIELLGIVVPESLFSSSSAGASGGQTSKNYLSAIRVQLLVHKQSDGNHETSPILTGCRSVRCMTLGETACGQWLRNYVCKTPIFPILLCNPRYTK
jgi:hypothetical protein